MSKRKVVGSFDPMTGDNSGCASKGEAKEKASTDSTGISRRASQNCEGNKVCSSEAAQE